MIRLCSASLVLFVSIFALGAASELPAETPLGQISAGGDTIAVLVREDSAGATSLAISAGNALSRQTFNLKVPCTLTLNRKLSSALKIDAADPSNAQSLVAGFGVDETGGDVKWVNVWLEKVGGRWTLRGEWVAEKFNHKELGEKTESQSFAFESNGVLKRSTSRNYVEGIKTTCEHPTGCCVVWQSKTLVTEEIETLSWNADLRAAERKTYQRWYVAQFGDGALSIARKVFGTPEKMMTLMRLNPALQKKDKIEEGEKILIERVGEKI